LKKDLVDAEEAEEQAAGESTPWFRGGKVEVALTVRFLVAAEAQREASHKQGVTLNAADLEEYRKLYVNWNTTRTARSDPMSIQITGKPLPMRMSLTSARALKSFVARSGLFETSSTLLRIRSARPKIEERSSSKSWPPSKRRRER
jgi:hypothetical protein